MCLLAATAGAVVVPQQSPAEARAHRHPGLAPAPAEQRADALAPDLRQRAMDDLAAFGVAPEHALFDVRSGRWSSFVLSQPLAPGSGVGNRVSWTGAGARHADGERAYEARVWAALRGFLAARQGHLRIDLDQLEAAPRVGVFERGDLITVYARRVVDGFPVRDSGVTAVLSHGNLVLLALQGWGDVEAAAGSRLAAERARAIVGDHARPFSVVGATREPHLEWIPLVDGDRYDYRLSWVVKVALDVDMGSWEGLVDARTGELLSFQDTNQYAARKVVGGVQPVSNDGTPPDGVEQPGWPMPFADITIGGNTLYTDSGGVFSCAVGTMTTNLNGRFIRINEVCGAINESSVAGDLDLGTSAGTNCTVPPGHSPGDTHSARTGFYELNRIVEQAKGYLPGNLWLSSQLTANMNINLNCNAFWNGSTVNFYREGGGCGNTGEIAAIFDHEWGHGMDNNGVNPNISSPGETIADIHALVRLNTSCIGRGFILGGNCDGYGDACTSCSGVRDIDFAKHASGQPHTLAFAQACPALGSRGPCNREVHCEGQVAAEAGFDLYARDLQAGPFNFDANTALEITTRLAFLGAQGVTNWYQCTAGTAGCPATSGYMMFLAADDDDGTFANGTPHMGAIFAAFNRHGLACATPAVANGGCAGGPTTAPTVSGTARDRAVNLTWSAVPNATRYAIYRTEGVSQCAFGKVRVGETTGLSFLDTGLQNGRPYSYTVWPLGASNACQGRMSSCLTVTPTPGANLDFGPAPTVVPDGGGDLDQFLDNCEVGRASFTVSNSGTGVLTNVRITSVTSPSHPTTTILTALPATISASLADCATANGSVQFIPQGMAFGDTLQLQVTVTADQLPAPRTILLTAGQVETNLQAVATRTYSFETAGDLQGWSIVQGTWTQATAGGGANGTTRYVRSSQATDNVCDQIRSPIVRMGATTQLSMFTNFTIEPQSGGIFYDRANVGVRDAATGVRAVASPSIGRAYNATGGAGGCLGTTPGWAGTANTFASSGWTPANLNAAGRLVQLDLIYATDGALALDGFRYDEVTLTNFDELVPDTQANTCASRVSFSAGTSSIGEAGGSAPIVVVFNTANGLPSTAPLTVQYATANGTANAGSDYTTRSGTLTFPTGANDGATQTINVPILNDALVEGPETFTAALSNPTGGTLGTTTTHTVTINDDDVGAAFIRGDFNSDGKTDILWRHDFSGENVLWYMNGSVLAGGEFLTPAALVDTRWKMVGTHDFNADLKNDILWRHDFSGENVLWFMNGSVLTSGTFLTPAALVDTNWKMAGTGVFDADSKPDIAWHHQASGQIVLWYMNGSVLTSGTFTNPASFPDLNWRLVGVADFSNPLDGKPDFVWRNQVTGELLVWFMDNATKTGETPTTPPALVDTRWKLVATGDYNLDLKNDFVWRHDTSGENVMWFMNGATLISGTFTNPATFPDVRWKMVGPR